MPEEDAFCVFVKLMQDYRMREIFKPTMAELGLCIFQLESMLQVHHMTMFTLYVMSVFFMRKLPDLLPDILNSYMYMYMVLYIFCKVLI